MDARDVRGHGAMQGLHLSRQALAVPAGQPTDIDRVRAEYRRMDDANERALHRGHGHRDQPPGQPAQGAGEPCTR
jgi:hypothetical protein